MTDASWENYRECQAGTNNTVFEGIRKEINCWTRPAIGICPRCGTEVMLSDNTNTCEGCQADYNFFGVRLAPQQYWGEETGETLANILGPQ